MVGYFSGTGNSKWIAEEIGNLIGKDVVRLTQCSLPPIHTFSILVFPVYAWGMPKWIEQFLDKAKLPNEIDVVLTCGDDVGMTDSVLQRYFSERNCRMRSCHSVQMPNAYVALPGFDVDKAEVVNEKINKARSRLKVIAERFKANKEVVDVVRGIFPRIKSYVLRPFFNKFLTGDKRFKVDNNACVHCNKCAEICPVKNIKMTDEYTPSWLHHCADCSACYHICPKHAIQHNSFTKNKGQKDFL